jgi:xanthine dehydrogenase accessory factor
VKNIYLKIPLNLDEIKNFVLATVTETRGSTPQKPGSSALFNRSGLVAGTVGGGVLEGKVCERAIECLKSGKPEHIVFNLDSNTEGGEDALCGGIISILIDPCLSGHIDAFKDLRTACKERIPGILLTIIINNDSTEISTNRYWITRDSIKSAPEPLIPYLENEIDRLITESSSRNFVELKHPINGIEPSQIILVEPVVPLPRLIIAGAGHIGRALAYIAGMLDFEITIIDDRKEYANSDNIPYADHIINDDIGNAISDIDKGRDAYIVIVTRGHRDDGNALKACIGTNTAYVGMIGSKTKVALMKKEFLKKGWATQAQWDKIYTPIGLDIKSQTVEEIAISIAAQLIKVKNNKTS